MHNTYAVRSAPRRCKAPCILQQETTRQQRSPALTPADEPNTHPSSHILSTPERLRSSGGFIMYSSYHLTSNQCSIYSHIYNCIIYSVISQCTIKSGPKIGGNCSTAPLVRGQSLSGHMVGNGCNYRLREKVSGHRNPLLFAVGRVQHSPGPRILWWPQWQAESLRRLRLAAHSRRSRLHWNGCNKGIFRAKRFISCSLRGRSDCQRLCYSLFPAKRSQTSITPGAFRIRAW
jgi:hypothetical protein